ncbi:MAG: alpha-L-fucosidase [Bacteroidales bacterium]|jgi:alpha-L-fucosidase|nr:alpha-L-fucosidase [Bacteroidales bacterium]
MKCSKFLGWAAVMLLTATLPAQAQKKATTVPFGHINPGDIPQRVISHQDPQPGSITIYGPYSADVNSIRKHKCPEWFLDAKFGMFIDWGIYSVPGWAPKQEEGSMYPDGYLNHITHREADIAYHEKTWGKDFQQDDFIPLFTAENYKPEWLAELAQDAGMKYIIPFCKHHDGFCLWPSSYTGRNALQMGPHKDLIRPLVNECNKLGLKFGFYFSVEEWRTLMIDNGVKKVRKWNEPPLPYEPTAKCIKEMLSGKYFIEGDFFADYIAPQAKEFINMYDPDILWFDGEWDYTMERQHTTDIISHFFNHAEGRKEVALNDRNGQSRHKIGDFFTSEYHSLTQDQKLTHPWEENRGISQSFGYNWQDTEENVLTVDEFIDLFVRTVSENGNLLLIVNLDGKGGLPEVQERRLREIGKWLKVNGEAIYSSRPWLVPNEEDGKIRFTQSKDGSAVYAICTDFPQGEIKLKSLYVGPKTKITMLGAGEEELKWELRPGGWSEKDLWVTIPPSLYDKRKNEYAWVFKISLD